MSKFLVIGQVRTDYTFNVEVEAEDFDEAETIAIARVKGESKGLVTIHKDSSALTIDNISVSKKTRSEKKKNESIM